jgi:hypothetical protein
LPAGITLNATTGQISGTPTAAAPAQAYTVTASNASGSTTYELNFAVQDASTPNERVTADRPDEKTGHQVHVIYALPSDGVASDEQLDVNGTIEKSLNVLNEWFAVKTGKKLRFDTYGGGKLDVTYLALPRTDAQMNVNRSSVRKELEEQLYLLGFDALDKMYLVYYGGDGENCGRGAWPPELPGNVAALYIGEVSGCRTVPFAAGTEPPAFLEFLALHEMLHVLGFVPSCAPNYARTGHVNDSVNDVMYSAEDTGTVLGQPSELDVNLDDYFTHGAVPGCLELSNSAFLDPEPAGAEAPPGWPYVDLADLTCEGVTPTPGPYGADTAIMFVNNYLHEGTPSTVSIFEYMPDPQQPGQYVRDHLLNVAYGDGTMLPNFFVPQTQVRENAVYVIQVNGNCLRTVRAPATASRFIIE